MGAASGISKSEVSGIGAGLVERVAAFRNRKLGPHRVPYVYLDAICVIACLTTTLTSTAKLSQWRP
jgi:transposase-like protein